MSRSLSLDSPPVTNACASTTERSPRYRVVADAAHGLGESGGVAAFFQVPGVADEFGLQVGMP